MRTFAEQIPFRTEIMMWLSFSLFSRELRSQRTLHLAFTETSLSNGVAKVSRP